MNPAALKARPHIQTLGVEQEITALLWQAVRITKRRILLENVEELTSEAIYDNCYFIWRICFVEHASSPMETFCYRHHLKRICIRCIFFYSVSSILCIFSELKIPFYELFKFALL